MITHVAVRKADGTIFSLPRPARHHDVLHSTGGNALGDEQGFLDDRGRFLRRAPALLHALQCGQVKGEVIGNKLYSENVW